MDAFQVMAAGCGGFHTHPTLPPAGCPNEPTHAGLRSSGEPGRRRSAWLGFACADHTHQLIAARPLLPRDRDLLERRRDQRRTELTGHRWAGEREGPLARGKDADDLLDRARAWAAAHPATRR